MTFMMIDTQPGIADLEASLETSDLGPSPEQQASQVGVLPPPTAALPPLQDLAGWYSLLIAGAETPVFDWTTLIKAPVSPTDATNKAYVDGKFNPLIVPGNATITGTLTVGGAVTLSATLRLTSVPTSNAGLAPGTLWNNGGFACFA